MVRISKRKLDDEVLLRIHTQFANSLLKLKPGKRGEAYLSELLTDSEKIMLAKRLAIIALLNYGYSPYRIAKTLKVSDVTASRMYEQLERGEFNTITSVMNTKTNKRVFWTEIEILLRGGMPPIGKDRWKSNAELRAMARRKSTY